MRRMVPLLLLLVSSALVFPAFGQDPDNGPLTNAAVVSMLKSGLSAEIVVAKIQSSTCNFDTSPTSLKNLKDSGVPDEVVLAMVKAPRYEGEKVYVKCDVGGNGQVGIYPNALIDPPALTFVGCGDALTLLGNQYNGLGELCLKVRTAAGVEGFLLGEFVSKTKSEPAVTTNVASSTPTPSAAPVTPARPSMPPNTLRAIAWRGVPWTTTSYYQQPGSGSTQCMGSGTWMGNMSQANVQCNTQYTPAQNVPINWTHYTIYNLVETANSYMVIGCTRNVVWSKCTYLIPGDTFSFERRGSKFSVVARTGKNKVQSLDFDIVSSQIKQAQTDSAPREDAVSRGCSAGCISDGSPIKTSYWFKPERWDDETFFKTCREKNGKPVSEVSNNQTIWKCESPK